MLKSCLSDSCLSSNCLKNSNLFIVVTLFWGLWTTVCVSVSVFRNSSPMGRAWRSSKHIFRWRLQWPSLSPGAPGQSHVCLISDSMPSANLQSFSRELASGQIASLNLMIVLRCCHQRGYNAKLHWQQVPTPCSQMFQWDGYHRKGLISVW